MSSRGQRSEIKAKNRAKNRVITTKAFQSNKSGRLGDRLHGANHGRVDAKRANEEASPAAAGIIRPRGFGHDGPRIIVGRCVSPREPFGGCETGRRSRAISEPNFGGPIGVVGSPSEGAQRRVWPIRRAAASKRQDRQGSIAKVA